MFNRSTFKSIYYSFYVNHAVDRFLTQKLISSIEVLPLSNTISSPLSMGLAELFEVGTIWNARKGKHFTLKTLLSPRCGWAWQADRKC